MSPFPDPVTLRQLPLIAQIVRDETWLEGERRGGPVSAEDPVVRENVCAVVLRIGREMRERLTPEMAAPARAESRRDIACELPAAPEIRPAA